MKSHLERFFLLLVVLGALALQGCGGGGGPWRYDPGIPPKVTGLKAEAGDRLVTLSWDSQSSNHVAEYYYVYYVSDLASTTVTRGNATKVRSDQASVVIANLTNNVGYHFLVTAANRDGESVDSAQTSATPVPPGSNDLTGTWYFHTLVTGPDAKWERGTVQIDGNGNAAISDFEDSAGGNAPAGFSLTLQDNGKLTQSGAGAWVDFHGTMGSRKNMMLVSWSPTVRSRAITIFQKKKPDTDPDYSIQDISGTGSGQNPYNPYIQGNGPTRFAYHQLYSGSSNGWEYANAKVGQHGNIWKDDYKDVIYWDFSNPFDKTVNYDYLWKVTSLGIDKDGLVHEYWNFTNVVDPVNIPSYNTLVPRTANEEVFRGRMTADRTVVVGVGTRYDASGGNPQYFLRIIQVCFIPTDQALPSPDLKDLAGSYRFVKLASTASAAGAGTASWAYGTMNVTGSGAASFPNYADSTGNTASSDTFTLAYYTDPNPDSKVYRDFANFVTPVLDGRPHYYDGAGNPLRKYYDFASFGSNISIPSTWRLEDVSGKYYNEHGSLSYNRDLFVMSRTDTGGYGLLIGLK